VADGEPCNRRVFAFVWQRTEEMIRDVEERGDELRARFAPRSLTILTDVRMSLDERPSIGELMTHRFLRRVVQDYRDHADFQEEWRLDGRSAQTGLACPWHAARYKEPEGESGATVCAREPRGLGRARTGQLVW
jgi:hypothetical protein